MKTILIALMLLAAQAGSTTQPPPRPAPAAADEYVVGVGDELQLAVFGEPEMNRDKLPIDPDGTIEVHQLGRVRVVGKTTRQIQEFIAEELVKKNLFVRPPSIVVRVIEFRSQSVRVQGYVKMPGEIAMEKGTLSLDQAIYKAGYFLPDAGFVVLVFSPRPGEAGAQMMDRKADLEVSREAIDTGRAMSIRLKDGDMVYVPRAPTFTVTGQVKQPGVYSWRAKLTVWEAVSAIAGGLSDRASKRSIRILRTVNGKQESIKPKNIEKDFVLPNDTIKVGSRFM